MFSGVARVMPHAVARLLGARSVADLEEVPGVPWNPPPFKDKLVRTKCLFYLAQPDRSERKAEKYAYL